MSRQTEAGGLGPVAINPIPPPSLSCATAATRMLFFARVNAKCCLTGDLTAGSGRQ